MNRIVCITILFAVCLLSKEACAAHDYTKTMDGILSLDIETDAKVDSAFQFLDLNIDDSEGYKEWERLIVKKMIPYAKDNKASDLTMAKLYYQLGVVRNVQGEERSQDMWKSFDTAESYARKSGNRYWVGRIVETKASTEINHGDPVKGLELEEEAIRMYRGAGNDSDRRMAGCLYSEAVVFFSLNDIAGIKNVIDRIKSLAATARPEYKPIIRYNQYALQTVYFGSLIKGSDSPREKKILLDSLDHVGRAAIALIESTPQIWQEPQALPMWDYYNRAQRFVEYEKTPVVDSVEYYLDKMTAIDFRGLEDLQSEVEISAASLRAEMWMKTGDYERAKQSIFATIEKADSLKKVNNIIIDKIELYRNLLEIARESGNYEEATQYSEKMNELEKERYSDERARAVKEIEIKYKTQETQLELARSKARQSTILMWLFAASTLLIIIVAAFIFYANRQRRRRMQQEIEFSNLRADTERRLTRQYVEGLETERERMSRELHDGVCNDLLAIQMNMRNGLDKAATERLIVACRDSVRRISHELMPPEFTYANIDEVVRYHVCKQNEAGIPVTYQAEITGAEWDNVPDSTALEIYRIIQEAIGNAIKHSGGDSIRVKMSLNENILTASVTDNGHYETTGKRGIGLNSMRRRANAIDAKLDVTVQETGGTKVALTVRLPQ